MMEPAPSNRPSIDEILLHPRLQTFLMASSGFKRSLDFATLHSPVVDKLRNPLSTRNPAGKAEMILISPRLLKSA